MIHPRTGPGFRVLFLVSALFLAENLPAEPFRMMSAGDPALEDLRQVAREGGRALLSLTPPLSPAEIRNVIQDADPEKLSAPGRDALARLEAWLAPPLRLEGEFFSLSFHIVAELELLARTNDALPWTGGDAMRPALLAFPLEMYFAGLLELAIDPVLTLDPHFNESGGRFAANVPHEARRIDLYFPFRAFAALGGPWWNFQIGRDRLDFGTARTGNLLVSSAPDYYDFARLSFFARYLKYSVLAVQIPLKLGAGIYDEGSWDTTNPGHLRESTQRHLYIHRLDVRPFSSFSFGLAEGLTVGNSALELRYLNPLMLFHNFISGFDYPRWWDGASGYELNSSIFTVELNWTPLPALAFHVQIAIDEFTTPWEEASDSGQESPGGMGYLAGVEWSRPFGAWGGLFWFEALYTDPYIYVDNSPFAAFIWMRRDNRASPGDGLRYRWLGHPEGRDAVMFAVGSRFSRGDRLSFGADFSFILHGEHRLYWDWGRLHREAAERTPTGLAEKKFTAAFSARWKPFPFLSLMAEISGIAAWDQGNRPGGEFGAEALFGIQYVF